MQKTFRHKAYLFSNLVFKKSGPVRNRIRCLIALQSGVSSRTLAKCIRYEVLLYSFFPRTTLFCCHKSSFQIWTSEACDFYENFFGIGDSNIVSQSSSEYSLSFSISSLLKYFQFWLIAFQFRATVSHQSFFARRCGAVNLLVENFSQTYIFKKEDWRNSNWLAKCLWPHHFCLLKPFPAFTFRKLRFGIILPTSNQPGCQNDVIKQEKLVERSDTRLWMRRWCCSINESCNGLPRFILSGLNLVSFPVSTSIL